ITEGEKKSLKACQDGFPCVGVTGIWCWTANNDKDENDRVVGDYKLISDFTEVKWTGRKVYIVFDSDASKKKSIRSAEKALNETLEDRGVTVVVVRLPDGKEGEKTGRDDFLVEHGADALRQLLDPPADTKKEAKADAHHGGAGGGKKGQQASIATTLIK